MLPDIAPSRQTATTASQSKDSTSTATGALPAVKSNPAGRRNNAHMQYGRVRRRNTSQRTGGSSNVRKDSRVGKLIADFGKKDDWVSKTILRHQMAVVIQSTVRGWIVRRRWCKDPQAVVSELHDRIAREHAAARRREELKRKLEVKLLTEKQKNVARTALDAMFGSAVLKGKPAAKPAVKPAGRWGKLSQNVDIAKMTQEAAIEAAGEYLPDNLSESDMSDAELDNMTAVKLRAKTPPWQRVEQCQWVGQFQKLKQKQNRGNLDVLWDLDENAGRLEQVEARRKQRDHEANSDDDEDAGEGFDPSREELPKDLIKDLLCDKYAEKFRRLKLDEYKPPQYGKLNVGLVDEGPMKMTAVRPRPDDAL